MRALGVLAATLALVLAGCLAPASVETASVPDAAAVVASEAPLWSDPQNAPHPAFGWPTLVNPASGAAAPEWWQPIAAADLPETVEGIELVASTPGVASGGGIALFGRLAVVPGFGEKSWIVDITDPAAPKVLAEFEPSQSAHRGAAVVAYPDGRLVTALSTGPGFEVWEITEPTQPVHLADVEIATGGHKLGIVPGTPILYNANSDGGGTGTGLRPETATGQTEIYDLTDPAKPALVQEFKNGYGCHHIFFWNSAEKQRALCAGKQVAQIWDVADPRAPVLVANVPIPAGNPATPGLYGIPAAPWAHYAALNAAGTVLVVGDEMGGGSTPPGCTLPGAPTGALWFYDVSVETEPKLLSWFSPGHHLDASDPTVSCTAHHGRLVPQEGRDLLAMSFYGAGVVLVDFTDPAKPWLVDQFKDGSDTWETWYYNGYLFTGDLKRGLDVLNFV